MKSNYFYGPRGTCLPAETKYSGILTPASAISMIYNTLRIRDFF